ncbi:aspartate/glutamate racemase family protein [Vibrio agarivorans]|uniref:aspartate/glutamate racemase family protein n=1 Tax=Vibrio agarivorans TaxID=153622 RepID=UPI0022329B10|nr:aspartate/glutamate racemase family protein [Vibrio agarivorans]
MKTIGLLGGMSWKSTAHYYQEINEGIKQQLGGLHSAKICLFSVDFQPIEQLQHAGDWAQCAEILSTHAKAVESGGADCLLICTNTMHKVAPEIEQQLSIPLIHIADATAATLVNDGIRKVALLGTRFTMDEGFYKNRIQDKYNIEVIVPHSDDQTLVHNIIYQELCQGVIKSQSKEAYLEIIHSLYKRGAEAVILGCTEIGLLVQQDDTLVKLYDTTLIHAQAAVDFALSE